MHEDLRCGSWSFWLSRHFLILLTLKANLRSGSHLQAASCSPHPLCGTKPRESYTCQKAGNLKLSTSFKKCGEIRIEHCYVTNYPYIVQFLGKCSHEQYLKFNVFLILHSLKTKSVTDDWLEELLKDGHGWWHLSGNSLDFTGVKPGKSQENWQAGSPTVWTQY